MGSRKNHKPVSVSRLFAKFLPQGYAQKRAQIQQFQHFFESQESDAVFQMVKVTNVTDRYVNVTLPNAALSSYLRLHAEQIRQQFAEYFGANLELKISTRPEVSSDKKQRSKKDWLPEISQSSCEKISSTANHIEDEELKNALKSLSKTLSKNSKKA